MNFECIKGIADDDNVNVVVMQGDIVKFVQKDPDGDVFVEGIAGWCKGWDLNFKPKQFVECFKVLGVDYKTGRF